MFVEPPEELSTLFLIVVGEQWPQADEELLRDLAGVWENFTTALDGIEEEIRASSSTVLQGWEGDAAKKFSETSNKLLNSDGIAQLIEGARELGRYARQTSTDIEYTKASIIGQLAILAAQIAWATPWFAVPTAAAAAAAWVSSMIVAARTAVTRLLLQLLNSLAIGLALQVGLDVAIQVSQFIKGTRQDWDFRRTAGAAVSAAVGAALGTALHNVGSKLLGQKAMESLPAHVLTNAAHEWGAEAGADLILTGFHEAPAIWSATAGATEGVVDWFAGKKKAGGAVGGITAKGPSIGDINIPSVDSTSSTVNFESGPNRFVGPGKFSGDITINGWFPNARTFVGTTVLDGTFTAPDGSVTRGTFVGSLAFDGTFMGDTGLTLHRTSDGHVVGTTTGTGVLNGDFAFSGTHEDSPHGDARAGAGASAAVGETSNAPARPADPGPSTDRFTELDETGAPVPSTDTSNTSPSAPATNSSPASSTALISVPAEPGSTVPPGTGAGVPNAGVPNANAGVPNAAVPNAAAPGTVVPNAGVPNAGAPNAGAPNAGVPNAAAPGTVAPNAGVSNAGVPNAAAPGTVAPNAGVSNAGVPNAAAPG
ncbi:MAG: hypothetical protein QG608_2502, partial [Actinomycetota bacterium]|nr:hypothetical protein [Actinomycetota bacterium]